jgi:thiol-disulfide isomerase/thioredoxin
MPSARPTSALLALLVAAAACACSRSSDTADGAAGEGATRWYRAVFMPPDTPEIPVYLQLPTSGSNGSGKIVTGQSQAELEVSWNGQAVTIAVPLVHASIEATADTAGNLRGAWKVASKSWGAGEVPFRARVVDGPSPEKRFDEGVLPGDPIDLGAPTTVWRARFPQSGAVKLTLRQSSPGVFDATVHFPTGNVAYLAGNGRGQEIRLSSVIGLSLYFLTAKVGADGKTLVGTWMAGPQLGWREALAAERAEDFAVGVELKTEAPRQRLEMPQLARYLGKPLIVELGGSWCGACKYAAVALKSILERHRDKGLQVVTLTYEFTDDTSYNRQQAREFKAAYAIPWEVIPVDGAADRAGDIIPPGIEGVDVSGFPITLFVNRDGTIRSVHGSFAGPEHPEEHRRTIAAYEAQAAAIVAAGAK